MQSLTVVELQPNLCVEDNRVVDGVRLVYPGIFLFKVGGKSPQTNQCFVSSGLAIERWNPRRVNRVGRYEVRTRAARSRNDGVGMPARPLLFAGIWGRRGDPD